MKENSKEVKGILAIGGLDPTGSAGVLMDVRAACAARVHAAVAVTTITVQDGKSFISSLPRDPTEIRTTLNTLLGSVPMGAVKAGALCNVGIVGVLADVVTSSSFPPLVIDPVISSTTGGTLLEKEGVEILTERLLPMATLLTPNLREAALISGLSVQTVDDMELAAQRIIRLGAGAVLIKGGHLKSDSASDVYLDSLGNLRVFKNMREDVGEVRGTGCALASLISAFIARGFDLLESIEESRKILIRAIRSSVQITPGPRTLNFD